MGIVYKLTSDTNQFYYGKTFRNIKRRMCEHKHRKTFENFTFEIIEESEDIDYINEREVYYINNFECINKVKHKTAKQRNNEYRERNRELINIRQKEKYHERKEEQREHIRKTNNESYQRNKNNLYNTETIICACGSCILKKTKARHEKTKKHLKFIQNI